MLKNSRAYGQEFSHFSFLNADGRRLSRQAKKLEAGSRTYDKNYCAGHAPACRQAGIFADLPSIICENLRLTLRFHSGSMVSVVEPLICVYLC